MKIDVNNVNRYHSMKVELLSITENAEQLIELAGRTAYQSQNRITEDSSKKFITTLVKMGHESVLEHASATFKISGISRACSHQLVRHRLASFTQRSQRYVSEKEFEYVEPESIKNNEAAHIIFNSVIQYSNVSYKALKDLGIKNEDCRSILPNACTTELIITSNLREFRHIILLRNSKFAQEEIKLLSKEILKILKKNAPNCFFDLEV